MHWTTDYDPSSLTPRARMAIAMRKGVPDRAPVISANNLLARRCVPSDIKGTVVSAIREKGTFHACYFNVLWYHCVSLLR